MRVVVVLLFGLALCVAEEECGLEELLKDGKALDGVLQCLLADSDKDCTEHGKRIREGLPDVVSTNCGSCDEQKKERVAKFFKHISEHRKEQLNAIMEKYDPTGESRKKWGETWKQQGVKI